MLTSSVKEIENVVSLQLYKELTLRKKCPYSELFWSAFSCIRTELSPNAGKCGPE